MAAKKKAAAGEKKVAKPKEMMLVQSKVKDYIRAKELNCASDLLEQLNDYVAWMLDRAAERAQANGRKTARASDV